MQKTCFYFQIVFVFELFFYICLNKLLKNEIILCIYSSHSCGHLKLYREGLTIICR